MTLRTAAWRGRNFAIRFSDAVEAGLTVTLRSYQNLLKNQSPPPLVRAFAGLGTFELTAVRLPKDAWAVLKASWACDDAL